MAKIIIKQHPLCRHLVDVFVPNRDGIFDDSPNTTMHIDELGDLVNYDAEVNSYYYAQLKEKDGQAVLDVSLSMKGATP